MGDYILATDKDGEHEELSIEDIIVHYNYNPSESHMNDIAIIKVNQTITFSDTVQPVCLIDAGKQYLYKEAVIFKMITLLKMKQIFVILNLKLITFTTRKL